MEKIDKKMIEDVCSGISSRREAREVVDWLSSSIEGQQTLSEMLDREAYLIEQEMDERSTPSQYRSQKIWDAVNRKIRVRRLGYFSAKAAVALIPFFCGNRAYCVYEQQSEFIRETGICRLVCT